MRRLLALPVAAQDYDREWRWAAEIVPRHLAVLRISLADLGYATL